MNLWTKLQPECEELQQRFQVPAVGLARIGAAGVESLFCLGERKRGSGVAVTENDLWHIGSCGKSMTATLMARLVERGQLQWDAPVAPLVAAHGFGVHPLIGPAGTVHLSLPDLVRYVAFHLSSGASAPGHLKKQTVDYLHAPRPGEQSAFGWFLTPRRRTELASPCSGTIAATTPGTRPSSWCPATSAAWPSFAMRTEIRWPIRKAAWCPRLWTCSSTGAARRFSGARCIVMPGLDPGIPLKDPVPSLSGWPGQARR